MSTPADRIKTAIQPVLNDDFATYIEGASECISELDNLIRDSADGIGWSALLDLDRIPDKGLEWLAQYIGVTIIVGLSASSQRNRIAAHSNWKRGSPDAIKQSAQLHLTGAKTVILRERAGSPWRLRITTYTSQTPDAAQTLKDILEQKPAGIVLDYYVIDGQDFQSLLDNHPTFADIYADYATFEGIVEDQPGT